MTEPANDVSALAAEDPGFWVKELAERRTRHRIGDGRFRERQDDRIPQMKLRRQARRSATQSPNGEYRRGVPGQSNSRSARSNFEPVSVGRISKTGGNWY
jgi:hypothetical protein